MNTKILATLLFVASTTTGWVNAASVDGLWTGQSFNLKSSGVIKKGQAIDSNSAIPRQVNSADIKVKFNCYLQIGKYDNVNLTYGYVATCQGKNGWEIVGYRNGVFFDLQEQGLGSSYNSDRLRIELTSTDGSSWDANNHQWGATATAVYYTGQYIFTPKIVNGAIKTATFMNPNASIIAYETWTASTDMNGIYKSNLSAKYSTGKMDAGATACLATYASSQGNSIVAPPCDPIE